MFATGETVGLAEWIIDDTPVLYNFYTQLENYPERINKIAVCHIYVCMKVYVCS